MDKRTDFQILNDSYKMGALKPSEFISSIETLLNSVGAATSLVNKREEILSGFADYISGILNGKQGTIEDYKVHN